MQQHLDEIPEDRFCPVVFPLVVHHDKTPWSGPTELGQVVHPELAALVSSYVPSWPFEIYDLNFLDEPAIRALPLTPQARVLTLLLAHGRGNANLHELLARSINDLTASVAQPDGRETLKAFTRYMYTVSSTRKTLINQQLDRIGPQAKEVYMTVAEELISQGLCQGLSQGLSQWGDALLGQLTTKFGPLPAEVVDAVQNATERELRTWTSRIIDARTLQAVFD